MNEKAKLDSAKFDFSQEGNCMDKEHEVEFLEIRCLSDLGVDNNENCFFVLKTESWSIDGVEELEELFDRIRKTLFPELHKNINKSK